MTETDRYRHRIPEIEAVQWTGTNADALRAFMGASFYEIDPEDRGDNPDATAAMRESKHNTWCELEPGDWVVKLGEGFYEFSATDFAERFEPAPTPLSGGALRDRIVAAIKASPFTELRTVDYAPNGPLQITVKVDDLADALARRLAAEPQQTQTEAHPSAIAWKIETPLRGEWRHTDATHDDHTWATERYQDAIDTDPARAFRLVRATTTYTVEAAYNPAAPVPVEAAANAEAICGIEPPRDGTWGDCWCTLPPGHDGEHQCQPCTDRHGAPGWATDKEPRP